VGPGTAANDVAHVRNGIDEREHPGRDAGHRERRHETVLPELATTVLISRLPGAKRTLPWVDTYRTYLYDEVKASALE
jgi:hypothetical protein